MLRTIYKSSQQNAAEAAIHGVSQIMVENQFMAAGQFIKKNLQE